MTLWLEASNVNAASAAIEAQLPLTPQSVNLDGGDEIKTCKRRKVVGGLRLRSLAPKNDLTADTDTDNNAHDGTTSSKIRRKPSPRQVRSDNARFPQRKPHQGPAIPVMEPTSGDKLILGIWQQIFSGIQRTSSDSVCSLSQALIHIMDVAI